MGDHENTMRIIRFLNVFALILVAVESKSRNRKSYIITHKYEGELVPVTVELDFRRQTEYVINLNPTITGRSVTFYDFKKRIIAYKDLTARQCFLAHMTDETLAKEQRTLEKVKHDATLINQSSVTLYIKNYSLPVNAVFNLAGKRVARFCDGIGVFLITNGKKHKGRIKRNTNSEKGGQFVHHAYGHYGHQSTNYAHYGHETYTGGSNGKQTQVVRQYQASGSNGGPIRDGTSRQLNLRGEFPASRNGHLEPVGLGGFPGGRGQFSLQTAHGGGYQINQPLGIKAGSSYTGGVRSQGQYGVGLGKQPYLVTDETKYPLPPPQDRVSEIGISIPGQIQPPPPAIGVQQPGLLPSVTLERKHPGVRQPIPDGSMRVGLPGTTFPITDTQRPLFPTASGLPQIHYPGIKDTKIPIDISPVQYPAGTGISQFPGISPPGIVSGTGDISVPSGIPSTVPSPPLPGIDGISGRQLPSGIISPVQPGIIYPDGRLQPGISQIPGRISEQPGAVAPGTIPGQTFGIIPAQPGIRYPVDGGVQPAVSHIPGRIDQQPTIVSPGTIPGQTVVQPGIRYPGLIDQQPDYRQPGIIVPPRTPGQITDVSRMPGIRYPDGRVRPGLTPGEVPVMLEQPGLLPSVPGQIPRILPSGRVPGQLLPGTIPSTIIQPPSGVPGIGPDVRYPGTIGDGVHPSITASRPGIQLPGVDSRIPSTGITTTGTPGPQLPLVGPSVSGVIPPTGTQNGRGGASSQTQVQTSAEHTSAQAKSAGRLGGLSSQTQVQGSHSGNGSFSAQAQAGFVGGETQSQVRGGRLGGAAGSGANVNNVGSAQSQVQANQPSGSSSSSAQGRFLGGVMQVQAQGGKDSGSAAAQAQSSGLSASQSQVNVAGREVTERDRFQGGGSASAQGGVSAGNSQTQLQGGYSSGRTYSATAQSGFDSRGISVSVPQHIPGAPAISIPGFIPGTPSQPALSTPGEGHIQLGRPPSAITPGVPSIPVQQPGYSPGYIPSIPGQPAFMVPGIEQIQQPSRPPSAIIPGTPSIPVLQPGYPSPGFIPSLPGQPAVTVPGTHQIQPPPLQQPGWPPSAITPGVSVPGVPSPGFIPSEPGQPSLIVPGTGQIQPPPLQQPGWPPSAITPDVSAPGIPVVSVQQPGYPSPGFIPSIPGQPALIVPGTGQIQPPLSQQPGWPPSVITPGVSVPGIPSPGFIPSEPGQPSLIVPGTGQIQPPLPQQPAWPPSAITPGISVPSIPSIPVQQPGYPPGFIPSIPGEPPLAIPGTGQVQLPQQPGWPIPAIPSVPSLQPGYPPSDLIPRRPDQIQPGLPSPALGIPPGGQPQLIPSYPTQLPDARIPSVPGAYPGTVPPTYLTPRPSCCDPKPQERKLCCDSISGLADRYGCCDSRYKQKGRKQSCCQDHRFDDDDDDGKECRIIKATCYIVYKSAGRARICRPVQTDGC